jgi:hypothetical protein
MKCMTQIPVPPMDTAPTASQRLRVRPAADRARAMANSPIPQPTHDIA